MDIENFDQQDPWYTKIWFLTILAVGAFIHQIMLIPLIVCAFIKYKNYSSPSGQLNNISASKEYPMNTPNNNMYIDALENTGYEDGMRYIVRPEVVITVQKNYVESKPVGELSHFDFGKPEGSLGCFLSYTPNLLHEPTERQIAYLKGLGVVIPDGITKEDASCMIDRATNPDDLKSPSPEIVDMAVGLNLRFSAFVGAKSLLWQLVNQTGNKNKAALFGYAIYKQLRNEAIGNMLKDPNRDLFYKFADHVLTDQALMRSLDGRPPEDYLRPHKGTLIYKASASWFSPKK